MSKFVSSHGYKVWREGDDYITKVEGHKPSANEASHAQAIAEYIVANEYGPTVPRVIHALAFSSVLDIPSVTLCGEVRFEKDLREDGVGCIKCLKVAVDALMTVTR